MAGALGHKISEMPHDLGANFFIHVISGLLKIGFQLRIKILALMFEFEEPSHVIDAGGHEINLLFWHAHITADQIHRGLHTMTKPDKLEARHAPQSPATHRHRVGVIKKNRVGAKLLHVARDFQQRRDVAQRAEDAARSQRVADALIHAIFQWDFVILPELFHATRLDHHDDVIRILQRLAPIRGGRDRGVHAVVFNHAPDERVHFVEPVVRQRHQPIFAAHERRSGQKIRHQGLAKDQAAGAKHCYFCHGIMNSCCLV